MAVTQKIADRDVDAVQFKPTGRRRFRVFDKNRYLGVYGLPKENVLILELEESALTTVGGITAQETRWREAQPGDCPNETVLGV